VKKYVGLVLTAAAFFICGGSSVISKDKQADKGQGKDKSQQEEPTPGDQVRKTLPPSEGIFTEHERVLINGWYQNGAKGLPPGLAKKEQLPPGLQKQLRKNGTLPPGLQKKVQPLPIDIERRLHVLPTGYRRVLLGDNVLILNAKNALIYDVMRLAIP